MTSSLMESLTPTISSFTYWILYGYLFILYDVFCLYAFDTFGSAFFFLNLNNVFLGQENLGTCKSALCSFLTNVCLRKTQIFAFQQVTAVFTA